jgi:hypothetical protein
LTRKLLPTTAIVIIFQVSVISADATAQSEPADATPTWDVAFMLGTLLSRDDRAPRVSFDDSWFHTGQIAVTVGRHWSTHFRTDLELGGTGEGRQYIQRSFVDPNLSYPVYFGSTQFTSFRQLAAHASWQFLENQWVHPFVQAGVIVDFQEQRRHTPGYSFLSGDPRIPGARTVVIEERHEGPFKRERAHGFVGGGAKFYVSRRFFLRTDTRFAFRSELSQFALRAGIGVDF